MSAAHGTRAQEPHVAECVSTVEICGVIGDTRGITSSAVIIEPFSEREHILGKIVKWSHRPWQSIFHLKQDF